MQEANDEHALNEEDALNDEHALNEENAFIEAIVALHDGLPRLGPGDDASTARALALCSGLPDTPRVADIGCGTGAQTLQLARMLSGTLIAIDLFADFLHTLRERAQHKSCPADIVPVQSDMHALPFAPESLDLCWSEGAMYLMGFASALQTWHSFLRPEGWLCVTELSWLQTDIPAPCKNWWETNYPAMQTVHNNIKTAQECGFSCKAHFTLPQTAWAAYYDPLQKRLPDFCASPESTRQTVAEQMQTELELFRNYSKYYGYEFYILQRL